MFLVQYWGGPTTYSEQRGHPRLRMRHAPFAIGPAERDAWLRHMRAAVDSLRLCPEQADDAALGLPGDGRAQHGQQSRMTGSAAPLHARRFGRIVRVHPRRRHRSRRPAGGATPSSTRSTSAASPTATATASATSPASGPGCPTSRDLGVDAHLDHPVLPLADGRRAATTSPTTATSSRCSAPWPRPTRCIAEAHDARPPGASSTSCPTTPPTSTRGSRRRWPPAPGSPGARRATSSATGRGAGRRRSRRTTGSRSSAARPGRGSPDGAVVPAPVRPRAARPQLGEPRGRAEFEDDPAVLARPRRRRLPHRRRPRAEEGPGLPDVGDRGRGGRSVPHERPGPPVLGPGRGARGLPRLARGRSTRTTPTAMFVAEAWVDDPERLARYVRADELHTAFNFAFLRAPVGRRRRCARRSTRRLAAAAAGRRTGDLGAVQPRRDPARHPLRPAATRPAAASSTRRWSDRTPRSTRRSGCAGPGRPRC